MSFHFYFPTFYFSNYRQNPKCLIEGKLKWLYCIQQPTEILCAGDFISVHFTCHEKSVSCLFRVCLDTAYFLKIKNLLLKTL